jgi:serine/threonine protein kinase
MITGEFPWLDKNFKIAKSNILQNHYSIPDYTPVSCANIISRLLVLKPENRMSAYECLSHQWFDSFFE